jgi:hypothetical protein
MRFTRYAAPPCTPDSVRLHSTPVLDWNASTYPLPATAAIDGLVALTTLLYRYGTHVDEPSMGESYGGFGPPAVAACCRHGVSTISSGR